MASVGMKRFLKIRSKLDDGVIFRFAKPKSRNKFRELSRKSHVDDFHDDATEDPIIQRIEATIRGAHM